MSADVGPNSDSTTRSLGSAAFAELQSNRNADAPPTVTGRQLAGHEGCYFVYPGTNGQAPVVDALRRSTARGADAIRGTATCAGTTYTLECDEPDYVNR